MTKDPIYTPGNSEAISNLKSRFWVHTWMLLYNLAGLVETITQGSPGNH
jgi:hypothetical protein